MVSDEYKVLILKSQSEEEDEDPYVKALNEHKIPAILVPILEFQFKNLDLLQEYLNAPENYSGFLFVSPRCVQSVIECYNRGMNAEKKNKWACLQCFVVGEATARIVNDNLHLPFSGSMSGNFKALLQSINPNSLDKPLLMPCGNLNKPLPEEKDYNIQKVVVYETRQHTQLKNRIEELLKDMVGVPLLVFFSPSGVEYAMPHIRNICNPKMQFVALGPTTSKAMEERNIKVSAVCEKPKPECLIREIVEIIRR